MRPNPLPIFMKKLLQTGTAALVALPLAGPAHAQQTTPTTSKSTRRAARRAAQAATAQPAAPLAPLPAPPADGPRPPRDGAGPGRDGDGPGLRGGRGPEDPGGPRAGRVQVLTDFSGTLTAFTADNDDQLYDGFGLKTSAGTEAVRFPRHLAQALMAAAKAGSAVTVTGFRATGPEGRTAVQLVSLAAGGQTVLRWRIYHLSRRAVRRQAAPE